MRALVLWADEVSANLGVRVLARGTTDFLRRIHPDAEVEYVNFGSRHPKLPLGNPRSLMRERVTKERGTLAWLSGFDVVLDTRSGDSFTDIYGARRLRIMSLVADFARKAGVPVVLTPQTIGPFDTRSGRRIGRRSLERASSVMARDSVSAAFSTTLGRRVDALTTDVVFALPTPQVERTRDVVLNVSGLLAAPGPHTDPARYRRIVAELHRRLVADGRRVSLLVHVLDSGNPDNDHPAVLEHAREVAPDAEILVPGDLDDVRAFVGSAQLVIGSRMHACLNALSMGTPAIPLAYSRKFAPLLGDLGWTATVDLRIDDPAAAVLAAAAETAGLAARVSAVRERAAELLAVGERALREVV